MWIRRVLIAFSLALTSCTHVVSVTRVQTTALMSGVQPGIPFYVKTDLFHRTSVYDTTWLHATLTISQKIVHGDTGKEATPDESKQSFVRNIARSNKTVLDDLARRIIADPTRDIVIALAIVSSFREIPEVDFLQPRNPVLVKNSIDSEWVVDSTATYFLNGPLPWFGAGNLSQELNADGTLSKASASPDTKLAEGLSSLLPIKEFLSGKFVQAAPAAAAAAPVAVNLYSHKILMDLGPTDPKKPLEGKNVEWTISLQIEELGYRYTLTTLPQRGAITDASPIPFTSQGGATVLVRREDIGKDSSAESKGGKDNVIGISGSITLPKVTNAAANDSGSITKPKK